jgi:hypothetical protein
MNSFVLYFLGAFFFTYLFELGLALIKGAIFLIESKRKTYPHRDILEIRLFCLKFRVFFAAYFNWSWVFLKLMVRHVANTET